MSWELNMIVVLATLAAVVILALWLRRWAYRRAPLPAGAAAPSWWSWKSALWGLAVTTVVITGILLIPRTIDYLKTVDGPSWSNPFGGPSTKSAPDLSKDAGVPDIASPGSSAAPPVAQTPGSLELSIPDAVWEWTVWWAFIPLAVALALAIFGYRRAALLIVSLWLLAIGLRLLWPLLTEWSASGVLPDWIGWFVVATFIALAVPTGLAIFGHNRQAALWVSFLGLGVILYFLAPLLPAVKEWPKAVATGDWRQWAIPAVIILLLLAWVFKERSGILIRGLLATAAAIVLFAVVPGLWSGKFWPTTTASSSSGTNATCRGPVKETLRTSSNHPFVLPNPSCLNRVDPIDGCVDIYNAAGRNIGGLCTGEKVTLYGTPHEVRPRGKSVMFFRLNECDISATAHHNMARCS